eukprot:352731-Chlamydomonas_euryale.AAC.3
MATFGRRRIGALRCGPPLSPGRDLAGHGLPGDTIPRIPLCASIPSRLRVAVHGSTPPAARAGRKAVGQAAYRGNGTTSLEGLRVAPSLQLGCGDEGPAEGRPSTLAYSRTRDAPARRANPMQLIETRCSRPRERWRPAFHMHGHGVVWPASRLDNNLQIMPLRISCGVAVPHEDCMGQHEIQKQSKNQAYLNATCTRVLKVEWHQMMPPVQMRAIEALN